MSLGLCTRVMQATQPLVNQIFQPYGINLYWRTFTPSEMAVVLLVVCLLGMMGLGWRLRSICFIFGRSGIRQPENKRNEFRRSHNNISKRIFRLPKWRKSIPCWGNAFLLISAVSGCLCLKQALVKQILIAGPFAAFMGEQPLFAL